MTQPAANHLRFRVKYYDSAGLLVRRQVIEGKKASDMPYVMRSLSDRDENNQQSLYTFHKVGRREDEFGPYLRYEER